MKFSKNLVLASVLSVIGFSAHAKFKTDTLITIDELENKVKVIEAEKTDRKKKTLVVFDIDNTLLVSQQELGGDLWYNWQRSDDVLPEHKLNSDCLFNVATFLLSRNNTYQPVEVNTVKVVDSLSHKSKLPIIALTSRSPELRLDTERALKANNINLSKTLRIDPQYDLGDSKLNYANGLFMTTGADKGKVLIQLLGKHLEDYSDIIFVDDTLKNITNMNNAFDDSKITVHSFYYPKVEEDWNSKNKSLGKSFNDLNGSTLNKQWKEFISVYGTTTQKGLCAYKPLQAK